MVRKSRLFTNRELDLIAKRESGIKSDKFGVFSRRIKPKIEEILKLDLNKLKKLLV